MRTYDKKKYIEFLKQELLSKAFPPSFEGDYSYYSRYHYLYNCYSYALQLSMDEDEIAKNEKNRIKYGALEASSKCEYVYTPGFTVRDNTHLQDEKMIEDYLLEDCDKLGIPIRKINTMTCSKQDAYIILMYLKKAYSFYEGTPYKGFHFFRQNDDQTWSEKDGYLGEVNRIKSILDIDEYMKLCGLNFVGVYELSKPINRVLK